MILCSCGREAEDGKYECFRCRVLSVGYVWRGGGHQYGRENFSSRTNAEYVNEHIGFDTKEKLKSGEIAPASDFR